MGRLRWYKRFPDAALQGMMALSLEERGAYNTILDLIYCNDGGVVDDDRFVAGWMRCDVRVWKRIKDHLLALKKLYIEDGKIKNTRADVEVDRALSRAASAADAGRASASKRRAEINKNNNLAPTTVERPFQPYKNIEERKKDSVDLKKINGGDTAAQDGKDLFGNTPEPKVETAEARFFREFVDHYGQAKRPIAAQLFRFSDRNVDTALGHFYRSKPMHDGVAWLMALMKPKPNVKADLGGGVTVDENGIVWRPMHSFPPRHA